MKRTIWRHLMICAAVLTITGCFTKERSFNRVFREHWLTQVKSMHVRVSPQGAAEAKAVEFNPQLLKELLPRARYYPGQNQAMMKGVSIVVARLEGDRKLRLWFACSYGAFQVPGEDGYYYFESDEDKQRWDAENNRVLMEAALLRRARHNRERAQPALP